MPRAVSGRLLLIFVTQGLWSNGFAYQAPRLRRGSLTASSKLVVCPLCTDSNNDSASMEDAVEAHPSPPQKLHTLSVCMVPPPSATKVWAELTKARAELRDPGLFRWPPHANILYPFIQIKSDSGAVVKEEIVDKFRKAMKRCAPFRVSLETLGTFGGKNRGVLWIYPRSYRGIPETEKEGEEPLVHLQALLEKEFPMCTDQRKGGLYHPHMTLSHFPSLDEAQSAQWQIEQWWDGDDGTSFQVEEVYLLERKGNGGQFMRVTTLPLGKENSEIQLHDPPSPFPGMPLEEEDWVKEERMKLKERRNHSWKGRRHRRGRGNSAPGDDSRGRNRSTDTPEIIAAKRADRKAKLERLERERLEQEIKESENR